MELHGGESTQKVGFFVGDERTTGWNSQARLQPELPSLSLPAHLHARQPRYQNTTLLYNEQRPMPTLLNYQRRTASPYLRPDPRSHLEVVS